MTTESNDRQSEALRRVYAAVVEFLDDYERSEGFSSWRTELGGGEGREGFWGVVEERHHAVSLAAEKERFDLGGLPVYDAVLDFIDEDLLVLCDRAVTLSADGTLGVDAWSELGRIRPRMREAFATR